MLSGDALDAVGCKVGPPCIESRELGHWLGNCLPVVPLEWQVVVKWKFWYLSIVGSIDFFLPICVVLHWLYCEIKME